MRWMRSGITVPSRYLPMAVLTVFCSSCSSDQGGVDPAPATGTERAAIERLELRLDQLEQRLRQATSGAVDADPKAPAGPLDSLTLQLGSDDDRLRLYWKDGQTSNLSCSQEGQGKWACG